MCSTLLFLQPSRTYICVSCTSCYFYHFSTWFITIVVFFLISSLKCISYRGTKCFLNYWLQVATFLLAFIFLIGAWLGFWVVHKFVLDEDGSIDTSTSLFVTWCIRILAALLILQVFSLSLLPPLLEIIYAFVLFC